MYACIYIYILYTCPPPPKKKKNKKKERKKEEKPHNQRGKKGIKHRNKQSSSSPNQRAWGGLPYIYMYMYVRMHRQVFNAVAPTAQRLNGRAEGLHFFCARHPVSAPRLDAEKTPMQKQQSQIALVRFGLNREHLEAQPPVVSLAGQKRFLERRGQQALASAKHVRACARGILPQMRFQAFLEWIPVLLLLEGFDELSEQCVYRATDL